MGGYCSKQGDAESCCCSSPLSAMPMSATAEVPVPLGLTQREKGKTMGRRSTFKYLGGLTGHSFKPGVDKSPEDEKFIADVLRGNPNFHLLVKLNNVHIDKLVKVAWKQEYLPGQMMMHEGDLSNEVFYMVQEGSFDVVSFTHFEIVNQAGVSYVCRPQELSMGPVENKKTVRSVGRGLCIGDRSMAFNQPRLATAQAKKTSIVWHISQSDFKIVQNQAIKEREINGGREALGKTPQEQTLIEDALRLNANLQSLVPLNSEHIRQLVAIAYRQEVAEGHVLVHEGDFNAEAFYIVTEGCLEACGSEPFGVVKCGEVSYSHRAAHTGEKVCASKDKTKTTATYERGHCFGEISMLHCAPCFATVKALKKSVVWVIDRSNFQLIQMKGAEEIMKNRVKYLESLGAARTLPTGGRDALAGLMDTMRFNEGEAMLREGATYSAMYILFEGKVVVEKDGKEQKRLEGRPSQGTFHYFAEAALKKDRPHDATVRVVSPHATVLVLERVDFMSVWDQVIEGASSPIFERLYTKAPPSKNSLTASNLTRLGLLGCATFGPVELVKLAGTGETYAQKTMSKGLIARKGMIASVAQEKGVWEMLMSPFVVKLVGSISAPQTFSLILEAALGGELSEVYDRESLHGSAPHARYYVAGLVLGLDCLHRLKVAYRNLKPHNVLLSSRGHPKLTDMGLAKIVIGQTFTMCGAPNYMAPEVLAGTGHGRAVDWWSLGVLAFELMAGYAPFESDHPMRVYMNVMRGIARVELPTECRGAVGDFVTHLLKPQAIERLPMRQGGIGNIKGHEWFADFDWQSMQALTLAPPYLPKLTDNADVSKFKAKEKDLPQPVAYDDEDCLWEEEFGAP